MNSQQLYREVRNVEIGSLLHEATLSMSMDELSRTQYVYLCLQSSVFFFFLFGTFTPFREEKGVAVVHVRMSMEKGNES